jgi:hypothetical protein
MLPPGSAGKRDRRFDPQALGESPMNVADLAVGYPAVCLDDPAVSSSPTYATRAALQGGEGCHLAVSGVGALPGWLWRGRVRTAGAVMRGSAAVRRPGDEEGWPAVSLGRWRTVGWAVLLSAVGVRAAGRYSWTSGAEDVDALHASRRRFGRRRGGRRRSEPEAAVRPGGVEVRQVRGQYSVQLPAVEDQGPAQALGPDGPHPALSVPDSRAIRSTPRPPTGPHRGAGRCAATSTGRRPVRG